VCDDLPKSHRLSSSNSENVNISDKELSFYVCEDECFEERKLSKTFSHDLVLKQLKKHKKIIFSPTSQGLRSLYCHYILYDKITSLFLLLFCNSANLLKPHVSFKPDICAGQ